MPRNTLQEDSVHNFSRNWNNTGHPAAARVNFLAFFEGGCDIYLSPVNISQRPWKKTKTKLLFLKLFKACIFVIEYMFYFAE